MSVYIIKYPLLYSFTFLVFLADDLLELVNEKFELLNNNMSQFHDKIDAMANQLNSLETKVDTVENLARKQSEKFKELAVATKVNFYCSWI